MWFLVASANVSNPTSLKPPNGACLDAEGYKDPEMFKRKFHWWSPGEIPQLHFHNFRGLWFPSSLASEGQNCHTEVSVSMWTHIIEGPQTFCIRDGIWTALTFVVIILLIITIITMIFFSPLPLTKQESKLSPAVNDFCIFCDGV